jgi:acetate---CoA ligase (ADP-forming)
VLRGDARARGAGWLGPDEVLRLLGLYGVSVVDQRLVETAAEAADAARQLGGEVALTAVAPGLLHKSDVGVNDPQFGPTVACGAGGTLVELLKDVSVRLSPLTRRDAASMLRELRSFPLLEGYRSAAR